MPEKIKEFTKGESRSLLEAAEANKLVRIINALLALQIKPENAGKLTIGDTNAVLDLTPLLEKALNEKIDQRVRELIASATASGSPT